MPLLPYLNLKLKALDLKHQLIELDVNVLDIWSTDDEERGRIDLWKDDKGKKAQLVGKVDKKEKVAKSNEPEKEKAESEKEEKKDEKVLEAKRDKKTLTSVRELLINSKAHREALVLALDHKKILVSHTSEQIVCSLTESPPGAMVFTYNDLPLEGRDHHKTLFIKA